MKYHCMDEECGFYKHIEDADLKADKAEPIRVCPNCMGPVLAYENHRYPSWIKQNTPTR